MNVLDFRKMKQEKRKISMVTCYDHWTARIIAQTEIDCILVGDSVAMVVHGHPSTLNATTEMIALHTQAVTRGAPAKFVVADMPFPTFQKGVASALECVDSLVKSGAHAVKLEGVRRHEEVVQALVRSGIPVMGHLGLTPQSIHAFGGFRVQARDPRAAEELKRDALALQELGAFSIVLECVPSPIAAEISEMLEIPVIGIGAGNGTDGQVLVLQDLLGMNPSFKPKFVRHFFEGEKALRSALTSYHQSVLERSYPSETESYS